MTNLYTIERTDQHHATKYHEFGATPAEAEAQFRKYWNITKSPVSVTLTRANVPRPFEEAK